MRAFEIDMKVNAVDNELIEFTGRFSLGVDNYVRGVVEDNDGKQSYLYGHYDEHKLVCVNIRNIEMTPKLFYFFFFDINKSGLCYFSADDFTSHEGRNVEVEVSIKEIEGDSDSVTREVENHFIDTMQRYGSSELLTSLYCTIENLR